MTLDSGALIAFERKDRRVLAHLKVAEADGIDFTVPAAVVAEVWRGGPRASRVALLLGSCTVEPLSEPLARSAGEAISAIGGAGTIDAIVMASAAKRGDRVLTSDPGDLTRLSAHFPGVQIVSL